MGKIQFKTIPIGKIFSNPYQPREKHSEESIREMAESIGYMGLLQPIVVRQYKDGYQIVYGDRRWQAVKSRGEKKIPAIIKDVTDKYMLLESLIENIHREDLTSTEHENAVYELWKSGEYKTKRELAKILGYAERSIGDIIEAKEFRDKTEAASVSTRTISDTSGLDEESREKIIKKVEEKKLEPSKVREVSETLKSAKPEVRQLILDKDVDIEKVKAVVEYLEDDSKQMEAIKEIIKFEKVMETSQEEIIDKTGMGRVKEGMRLLTAIVPEDVLRKFRYEVDKKHGTRWGMVSEEVTIALKDRTKVLRDRYIVGVPVD